LDSSSNELSPFTIVAHRARSYSRLGTGDVAGARSDLVKATEIAMAWGKGGEIYLKSLEPLKTKMDVAKQAAHPAIQSQLLPQKADAS
jgi:hypothetical protein